MNCYLVLCFVTLAYGADPICYLPPDSGPCLALFPKYYYDPKSCGCKPFTYGGCQGNENRFETKEECEQRCGVDPICGRTMQGLYP